MGDVIHALPAVADLAKAQPDLTIEDIDLLLS